MVEVAEDVAVGTLVCQTRARSALHLTYQIVRGNLANHFTINPTSGVISTRHLLDYETTPVYNLTISATNLVQYNNNTLSKKLIKNFPSCSRNKSTTYS